MFTAIIGAPALTVGLYSAAIATSLGFPLLAIVAGMLCLMGGAVLAMGDQ